MTYKIYKIINTDTEENSIYSKAKELHHKLYNDEEADNFFMIYKYLKKLKDSLKKIMQYKQEKIDEYTYIYCRR